VNGLIQRPVTTRQRLSVANRTVVVEVAIRASARLFWQSPPVSSQPWPKADRLYLSWLEVGFGFADGLCAAPFGNRPPAARQASMELNGV